MKTQNGTVVLLLILALTGCSGSDDDPEPTEIPKGGIAGNTTDSSTGAVISGVLVSITSNTVMSGNDGTYTIPNVGVGNHQISASKSGYNSYSEAITITENLTTTHDIALLPGSLAYYWNMDNSSISNGILQAIRGNVNGTITEAVSGMGVVGESLVFDGSNDYVTFGDAGDNLFAVQDGKFSFTMWIKPLKDHTYGQVFGKTGDSSCPEDQRQIGLQVQSTTNGNNFPRFSYQTLSGFSGGVSVLADTELPINTWSHLAITYDGSINSARLDRVKMYIDGQESNSILDGFLGDFPFDIQDGTAHLSLGDLVDSAGLQCQLKTDNAFNGEIDEFAIWNDILTVIEIANIRQSNMDGNSLVQ